MKAALALALAAVIGLGIVVVLDRREVDSLQASHDARLQFCRGYRGTIHLLRTAFANPKSDRSFMASWFVQLSQGNYLDLCQIDHRQLEPEMTQLTECSAENTFKDPRDYSCYERAAAKLEQQLTIYDR